MDTFLLALHSLIRWIILLLFIYVIYRYAKGLSGKKNFEKADEKAGLFLTISLDIQLLIGLYLYFVMFKFQDLPMDMKDQATRFWKIEHIAGMIIAIIVAHIGKVMLKKKSTSPAKFKTGLIWYILSLIIILATIPWPFREGLGGHWVPQF